MSTHAIINNINMAIAVIERVPEDKLDLYTYKQEADCGTLYCAAGHLCQSKHFADLGMTLRRSLVGGGPHKFRLANFFDPNSSLEFLDEIFGEDAFYELFEQRNRSLSDHLLHMQFQEDNEVGMTDKELALARLNAKLHIETARLVGLEF